MNLTAVSTQLLDHFLSRLDRAPADLAPCYHKVVEEALPPAIYGRLLDALPHPDRYSPARGWRHTRQSIQAILGLPSDKQDLWLSSLRDERRLSGSDGDVAVWLDIDHALSEPRMTQELCDRLHLADSSLFHVMARLVREDGASFVRPHLDKKNKVLTIIFYLTAEENPSAMGTTLFGPDAQADPDKVVTVPFAKNTALFLPRTNGSVHGVQPHVLEEPRVTLQLFLMLKEEAV